MDFTLLRPGWSLTLNKKSKGLLARVMTDQEKTVKRIPLVLKLTLLILAGFAGLSAAIMFYSEEVLEEAILEQVKKQAEVFLFGFAHELDASGVEFESAPLEKAIEKKIKMTNSSFGFSVSRIYIYDSTGKLVADSARSYEEIKDMEGFHGQVITNQESYLGHDIDLMRDEATGELMSSTDIIVPLTIKGRNAALEVEINLDKTMENIKRLDDRYERQILIMILVSVVFMIIFLSIVIKRGLLRPMHLLSDVTGKIADGNLRSRVSMRTGSEMDRLGKSINKMADSIEELFKEQDRSYLQTIQSLAKALEERDAYTAGHSERVTEVALRLGNYISLPRAQLELLRQGAYMHDLGKIGISDAILNKEGSLEEDEYGTIKSHPEKTAAIMAPLKRFKAFAEIAAWHHEKWDGTGYPHGLKGEEIPLLARIVAIADAWDAMTSDRRYRKGKSHEEVLSIMEREKESGQWDPELMGKFIEMMKKEPEPSKKK